MQVGKPSYKAGSWVEFECRHGYKLHGHRFMKCIDGSWSSPLPACIGTCMRPTLPENADDVIPFFILNVPSKFFDAFKYADGSRPDKGEEHYGENELEYSERKPEWQPGRDELEWPQENDMSWQSDVLVPIDPIDSHLNYLDLPLHERDRGQSTSDGGEQRREGGESENDQRSTQFDAPGIPNSNSRPQSPIENPMNNIDLPLPEPEGNEGQSDNERESQSERQDDRGQQDQEGGMRPPFPDSAAGTRMPMNPPTEDERRPPPQDSDMQLSFSEYPSDMSVSNGFIGDPFDDQPMRNRPTPMPESPEYGPGEFPEGTKFFFECDLGTVLVGMEVIRCHNGRWNGIVPICVGQSTPAPEDENARHETTKPMWHDDKPLDGGARSPSRSEKTVDYSTVEGDIPEKSTFRPTCPPTITEGSCENAVTGPSYRSTLGHRCRD
ncbi:CUB and sushi domain-containing protein 3-like [Ptychodera flava]|uniref:CUB and sushi domain-containing protein 3-like n=1 Tax=Ptychodera flava TaxID=63121 RepID=UPI00396A8191